MNQSKQKEAQKMSLVPVIEAVVDEKVQANELFTAHDITLEVRSRSHRASHGEVKDAVHDYYGRGGLGVAYTRTIITVPGGGSPFLYHRSADDPSTYQNIRGGTGTVNTPTPTTIAIPAFGQTTTDGNDGSPNTVTIPQNLLSSISVTPLAFHATIIPNPTPVSVPTPNHTRNSAGITKARKVDGRGTLSIPSPIIRQVGFQPRQKVYAVAATNGVDIVATKPPASAVFSTFTVDDHEQVRLTQSLLERAGISGTKYDVEQTSNKVIVKLSK